MLEQIRKLYNEANRQKKNISWLNAMKGIAIIAVMQDHSGDILYTDGHIQKLTFFSVSLFFLISGYTSYLCHERYAKETWGKYYFHKIRKILAAYVVAAFIYTIYTSYYHTFSAATFFSNLIRFDISGPFYYVFLYMQVMVFCKCFCGIVSFLRAQGRKKEIAGHILILAVLFAFSVYSVNRTNMFDLYGGAGCLFGGTYLLIYYIGILFARIRAEIRQTTGTVLLVVTGMILLTVGYGILKRDFFLDNMLNIFTDVINPPGLTILVYAITVFGFLYFVFYKAERNKYGKYMLSLPAFLGKYSLYIFLYHRLFLDFVLPKLIHTDQPTIRFLLYFAGMIIGSIVLGVIANEAICLISHNGKGLISGQIQKCMEKTNDRSG